MRNIALYRAFEFDRLAKSFETASFPITLEIFQKGIEVELSLDEATLIAKLKVIGAVVLGIYVSVSQYKDFRESVIQAVHDADALGVRIIQEFKNITGASESLDIIYKRTIPRDLNRLQGIVEVIDHADTYVEGAALTQVTKSMAGLHGVRPRSRYADIVEHSSSRASAATSRDYRGGGGHR